MNISILANKDIASNFALNILAPKLSEHKLSVFLSESVGDTRSLSQELLNLKFFEQTLFNELLFPLFSDDREQEISVKKTGAMLSFEDLGKLIGSAILPLNDINKPSGLARLSQAKPDLIVSIRYGLILRQAAIAIPKFGVINLHSGLLPSYKGVMASFRALLNGDDQLGMTLHYILDKNIDTGTVIKRCTMPVDRDKSYLLHVLQLYPSGCELVIDAIHEIEMHGAANSTAQSGDGKYYSFPNNEELAEFYVKGLKLFDGGEILDFFNTYYR